MIISRKMKNDFNYELFVKDILNILMRKVQEFVDMPKFDDNGELDVYTFSNNCKKINPGMTEANYENYVANYIDKQHVYGGTCYAPVIKMIDRDFNNNSKIPTIVFFITDGNNSDKTATDEAIRTASEHGIFYMFIGIGNEKFTYLQKLDDLTGRKVDNTGFMKIQDLNTVSNDELFLRSLKDFIPWLKTMGYIA